MIDTHAHLAFCEPDDAELVAAARAVGVRRILTVGLDEATNREAIAAAEGADEVFAAVGRHPNSAEGFDDAAAADILRLAADPAVRAIGETGLDFYRDTAPREDQRAAFAAQIGIARETGLPLVIHVRDRAGGTRRRRRGIRDPRRGGGRRHRRPALLLGAAPCRRRGRARLVLLVRRQRHLSEGRTICARRRRRCPAELLLVETDSPFLSPQAHRGERNQPAHVVATAEAVADARGLPYGELERLVEENAARVFGW